MSDTNTSGIDRSAEYVANARGLLSDYEEADVEVRIGAIKHAIAELQNARRELPDDY